MKNALLILGLVVSSAIFGTSSVIYDRFPKAFSGCLHRNLTLEYECIISKFDDPHLSQYSDEDIHLRLVQNFYWHPTKRIRRECRALPRDEWKDLVDAINVLKKDKSLFPNVYDHFADFHTLGAVSSVHFGSNFFGWHRCFILKFEELLRKINPNVTLCFWDSRMDQVLKDPKESIMFTDMFLGNMEGPVKSGPLAGWKTIRNIPLRRNIGEMGNLISPANIDAVLSKSHHKQITTPTADEDTNVESFHNMVHAFIGGQMNDFNTSSQDPYFWLHHCFIDSVWEKFCTKLRKMGTDPQDDYVILDDEKHKPNRIMDHLSPLKNIDGYSDYYGRHIYEYADYGTCPDCLHSPILKCDKKINKCRVITKYEKPRTVKFAPKRIETNHLSSPKDDVIFLSGEENINKWVFIPIKLVFRNEVHKSIRHKDIVGCEYSNTGSDVCSKSVAIVQSNGLTYGGTYKNYIVNDVCIPQWSYAYVAVRNPELGPSEAFISITDKNGSPCTPYCLSKDKTQNKYIACPGFISVTTDTPKMYENTVEEAKARGFYFDPLQPDTLDRRIKMTFLCYE